MFNTVFKHTWVKRILITIGILIVFLFLIRWQGQRLNERESFRTALQFTTIDRYDSLQYTGQLDSLYTLYGLHKRLPKGYELQTLLALSHYPELRTQHIHFFQEEALIPLASRPHIWRMFRNKPDWQYNIIISTESVPDLEPALLKNLPFDAQVGIIGHEMSHTVFYLDKNWSDIIVIGINYVLFPSFRAQFESNTDRRTIVHGLGSQLMHHARHMEQHLDAESFAYFDHYYLDAKEIKAQMQALGLK